MKSFGVCNSDSIWVSTSQVMRQLHPATTDSERRSRSMNAQKKRLGEREWNYSRPRIVNSSWKVIKLYKFGWNSLITQDNNCSKKDTKFKSQIKIEGNTSLLIKQYFYSRQKYIYSASRYIRFYADSIKCFGFVTRNYFIRCSQLTSCY